MTAATGSGGLGFSVMKAGSIYGFYTAMVYLLSLPGGWVADRLIGQRRAVLVGGMLIAAGNFALAAPRLSLFYAGLGLLMLGTGLLKPNVSAIVGQLYTPGDRRRDSGFSIFYMGINIGAFSPLIVGWVGEKLNWRLGFATSAIGMVAGLAQFLLTSRYLGEAGLRPATSGNPARDRALKRKGTVAVALTLSVLLALAALISFGVIRVTAETISNGLGWVLVAISIGVFSSMVLNKNWSHEERRRAVAILVLFLASAVFWGAYEQAGSSLNLFGERNTNRYILGYQFPASWFQWIEPLFVIILAPLFAWLWLALGRREPSTPTKFSLGLLFVGLGFLILVPAATGTAVSPLWLIVCYLLHTTGEMCLSPVGLSGMTKLAPARAAGFIMGVWFLATGMGNWLAGKAGSLYDTVPLPELFGAVAGIAILSALVLALLVRPTKRMMSGIS
jgi:POT family proton-dependent oligopeptide transporter